MLVANTTELSITVYNKIRKNSEYHIYNTAKLASGEPALIKQALIYCCKPLKKESGSNEEELRIVILYDNGLIGIYNLSGAILLLNYLDDAKIERIYKNTGFRYGGIICQAHPVTNQLLYFNDKFLRTVKLNGITPYVF